MTRRCRRWSGGAVYDAPLEPTLGAAGPDYVTLGEETVRPNGTKTSDGAVHDFTVTVHSGRDGFAAAKEIAAAVCDCLIDAPLALDAGRLVSLRFLRAGAERGRAPEKRKVTPALPGGRGPGLKNSVSGRTTDMAAQRGKDLLIKLDMTGTGDFETVAGLRATRISFNAETVDVTNLGSAGRWRELLSGAGVRSAGHQRLGGLPRRGDRRAGAGDLLRRRDPGLPGDRAGLRRDRGAVPDHLDRVFRTTRRRGGLRAGAGLGGRRELRGDLMANPWRGEVELVVDGEPRVMRLTLAALAELEARLKSKSLIELIARFEAGGFRVRDLIALLTAGLNGGGWKVSEAELVKASIDGGPLAAAQAAARLLKITFTLPDEDGDEAA